MGSGAYGVVMYVFCPRRCHESLSACAHSSAADEISGETVAIKLVTRVFDKIQLAKRALREITLLRHFASHENITGLIDVDAISPDFNEMYVSSHTSLSSFLRKRVEQLHFHGGLISAISKAVFSLKSRFRQPMEGATRKHCSLRSLKAC